MFERGRLYKRGELHLAYGSATRVQQQGGILTPRGQPFLLIITGEKGRRHGYADFWDDAGVLNYFGAGQKRDMQWRGGNVQLRDHAEIGKDLHVFEEVGRSLRYRGQFASAGYYERDDVPDTNGKLRKGFIFLLVPLEDISADTVTSPIDAATSTSATSWSISLDELRQRASRSLGKEPNSKNGKRRVWERSRDVKIYARRRANGICEGCDAVVPFADKEGRPYLEPHHTRRISDGGPDDPHHAIALCPSCHRRVHYGADGAAYNELLKIKLQQLEPSGSTVAA